MICEECNRNMRNFGQYAFCANLDCKQYGVRVLIGDE